MEYSRLRYNVITLGRFWLGCSGRHGYAKPVIASNVPGLAEVVGNKQLLFSPDNEKELAAKILQFYNNKEMLKDVGLACLKHARKFDIKNMAAQYVDFYNQLLKQKKDKQ